MTGGACSTSKPFSIPISHLQLSRSSDVLASSFYSQLIFCVLTLYLSLLFHPIYFGSLFFLFSTAGSLFFFLFFLSIFVVLLTILFAFRSFFTRTNTGKRFACCCCCLCQPPNHIPPLGSSNFVLPRSLVNLPYPSRTQASHHLQ